MSRLITANRVKYCTEPSCGEKFVHLLNAKTMKFVPVNYDTLSRDEANAIEGKVSVMIVPVSEDSIDNTLQNVPVMLCFNPEHHISHFKTCTKPNLFSSSKKEKKDEE